MEITKAKKGSDQYLMDWCDYVIGDLVKEKEHLFKAYNYFNGVRDYYQYQHLEENFGVGNPTSVSFTPLTRKHIEAIVGEYLTTKPNIKVSCKDQTTLSNIFREKQLEVTKQLKEWLSKDLENAIYQAIASKGQQPQQDQKVVDQEIQKEILGIEESVERNFISNYEIAAQNIIEYILQDRNIDFKNKLQQLLLDLLISGEAYYKVVPSSKKTNFKIELCDPLNTWIDKNPHDPYMKNGYKSVVRKWMTAEEIEIKLGNLLSEEDLKKLRDYHHYNEDNHHFLLITGQESRCGSLPDRNKGILNGVGAHPYDDDYIFERKWNLIPVYEVEWIDSIKEGKEYKGNCYKVTRVGGDIYILEGEDETMVRDLDSPNEPRLNVNGLWYTNGHGAPYSLMLATADLQDNYDLLHYQLDNLVALSGTAGAIVDISQLPEALGADFEERLMKFQGYRKIGLSLIDTSQEGTSNGGQFYNGFDDTRGLGAIQYLQVAIQEVEETVSSITGVFRERLGGIEQRDAVANVEVGMQQSYIITKRYYQAMDTLVKEMVHDCLDMAKTVYKKGITGQIILGNKKEIFTILPEYYTHTSYDIHLADSAEVMKEQELIKQIGLQYMQSNMMDPEIMLIISTSKSLTEMKELALKSIREKKIENNQLQQLQQQLEQAQQQMQQMQQQLEQSSKKLAQLNDKKLAIEEQNNRAQQSIDWYKVQKEAENKEKELELIRDRNKLEALQLVDDNSNNDEVLDQKR